MNHQVWRANGNDPRGIGGDQISMALSSWQLLYQYSGNEAVKDNMKFMADYYLTHSLSSEKAVWANIPYPFNTMLYSGIFDGDMVIGKGYTQPDKSGSFGWELLKLYKLIHSYRFQHATEGVYLDYAIKIANTLAQKTQQGDENNSPLPFKVSAENGQIGMLKSNKGTGEADAQSTYTTNWSATLNLFEALIEMNKGNTVEYQKAHKLILNWMKNYPLKTNKWGPFFEDVPGWSDTQINAVTFAKYIMDHRENFPNWKTDVKGVFDWVYKKLGNTQWANYGAIVVNEQTAYSVQGNSHSSRQAAAELLYSSLSGDTSYKQNAIRVLNWCTYTVDNDGKNCYPQDEVWLTDSYGDYIRHYLVAMAANPELAPSNANHILSSSSIIGQADYAPNFNVRLPKEVSNEEEKSGIKIYYRTYDKRAKETIRMISKPAKVIVDWVEIKESNSPEKLGWHWKPMKKGGLLTIYHEGYEVKVF